MKEFFKKNKIFLAIIIGAVIIGAAIYISSGVRNISERSGEYFSGKKENLLKPVGEEIATGVPQNCGNIPELPDSSLKLATKIIDGDTFLIEGGYSIRVLGIDADERDHPCYEAAKNKLEELILNREVKLEKGNEDLDQYCRYLRYVFVDNQNISLELVKEGLAVARFSPEDVKYREEISNAEKEVKENKIGCKWSEQKIEEGKTEFQWEKLTPQLAGLIVVDACQSGNFYEKEVIIEGKIVAAYRSKTNTVFLNFEKTYPNQCFTGVIFSSDQYKFVESPEKYYSNKTVRIKGEIKEYQGKPEIILKDPSQIEVGK